MPGQGLHLIQARVFQDLPSAESRTLKNREVGICVLRVGCRGSEVINMSEKSRFRWLGFSVVPRGSKREQRAFFAGRIQIHKMRSSGLSPSDRVPLVHLP